jgi:WD40 repeat protein
MVATADLDGRAYLWDIATGTLVATLAAPGGFSLYGVAFSPDGKLLAAADQDGSAYLWDISTRRRIATLTDPGSNSNVSSVAFSPDGKLLAAANRDGLTYLWGIGGSGSLP